MTFDPRVVSYARLAALAKERQCATVALPIDARQEKEARVVFGDRVTRTTAQAVRVVPDTKYYLRNTPLRSLPMTMAQATRVNADLKAARAGDVLSPSQKELLTFIEAHPDGGWGDVVDADFRKSWETVLSKRLEIEAKEKTSGGAALAP